MARISKLKLNKKVLERLFILFFEVVGNKNDKEDFMNIICDLMSVNERIMIAKRIAIMYLLLKGLDHVTITSLLKVSSATVAKFSLLLQKSSSITTMYKKILKQEQFMHFLEDIYVTIKGPGTSMTNWKSARQYKYNLERRRKYGLN